MRYVSVSNSVYGSSNSTGSIYCCRAWTSRHDIMYVYSQRGTYGLAEVATDRAASEKDATACLRQALHLICYFLVHNAFDILASPLRHPAVSCDRCMDADRPRRVKVACSCQYSKSACMLACLHWNDRAS